MKFADTNWLSSLYLEADQADSEGWLRTHLAERYMRKVDRPLIISHIVLLEARNVFSRVTGEAEPKEWRKLLADFDGKLYVDTMNWHLLRRECEDLFVRYSPKVSIGTLDVAILGSAKLAGCKVFLSFDNNLRALAFAEGLEIFPPVDGRVKALLAGFKSAAGKTSLLGQKSRKVTKK